MRPARPPMATSAHTQPHKSRIQPSRHQGRTDRPMPLHTRGSLCNSLQLPDICAHPRAQPSVVKNSATPLAKNSSHSVQFAGSRRLAAVQPLHLGDQHSLADGSYQPGRTGLLNVGLLGIRGSGAPLALAPGAARTLGALTPGAGRTRRRGLGSALEFTRATRLAGSVLKVNGLNRGAFSAREPPRRNARRLGRPIALCRTAPQIVAPMTAAASPTGTPNSF